MKEYQKIQNVALQVLCDVRELIKAGVTEQEITEQCALLLAKHGVMECWYHNVPAFVLVGKRTVLSVSGTEYIPSDLAIKETDLVTIDLSPEINGYWGDCARSFVVENGVATDNPQNESLCQGLAVEKKLHEVMQNIVSLHMTMHELFVAMNAEIIKLGYVNLDFLGNLGHSIERDINSRRYIEKNNDTKLGDVPLFTFEPHIRYKNGQWGFKRENIYYFADNKLATLGDNRLLEVI